MLVPDARSGPVAPYTLTLFSKESHMDLAEVPEPLEVLIKHLERFLTESHVDVPAHLQYLVGIPDCVQKAGESLDARARQIADMLSMSGVAGPVPATIPPTSTCAKRDG